MTITRYVNTASTAGGDGTTNATSGASRAYATLAAAISGTVSGGALPDHTIIYCSGTAADTAHLDHTPMEFTTTPTNYLEVHGDNTSRKWNTSAYRMEVTNVNGVYNQYAAHVRFYNMQIMVKATGGGDYICFRLSTANCDTSGGAPYLLFKNCIARKDPTSTSGTVCGFLDSICGSGSSNGPCYRINCLTIDCDSSSGSFNTDASAWAANNVVSYNCTAANALYGFVDNQTMKNCLATGCSFGFLGAQGSSDYNAEDDGNGLTGANSRSAQTFSFVDAASDDFTLTSSDAGAVGFGLDDPGSGLYSDDLSGQTRSSPWSIGALEPVAPTAALTGTVTGSIDEADIVAGGETVILTITDGTLVAAIGTPTFGAAATKGTTAANTDGGGRDGDGTLTCTFPSGYTPAAGDFALMVLYSDAGSGSVPTDWSEVTGSPFGSSTPKLQIFYKVLAGGESSPQTTISGSASLNSHCGQIVVYEDVGAIGAVGTASAGTGTPMTAGAINTTQNNSIVCAFSGRGDNESSSGQTFGGSGTGVNERLDGGTNSGNDSQVSMADLAIPTSGSSSGSASSTTSATDPWVSVQIELVRSTPFDDARAAIRNGLDSAQSEAGGWDAKVKPNIPVGNVVRTSDTVVTITLQAQSDYDITAQETITATIPGAAVSGGSQIVASPTFTVDPAVGGDPEGGFIGGKLSRGGLLMRGVLIGR